MKGRRRGGVGVVRVGVLVPAGGAVRAVRVARVARVDYCGDEAVPSDGFTPGSLPP
ncbi:hypothetical protein Slala03_00280 [Streptomyces lavendulae subsp. lavendulae]|nr:hypothetical protein Slala03_00280 [Streptomyces lavendulae subsp. lavendulae]